MQFRLSIRVTAFFTALIFSSSGLGWGMPEPALRIEDIRPALPFSTITIPPKLGTIQDLHQAGEGKPWVIYIQDAHAVVDAQNNIQKLIEYLQESYKIPIVALEGAKGKLDSTLLSSFPDPFIKEKIMRTYLEKGELSGGEMAAIFSPYKAAYHGIEDWGLYEQNYQAYWQARERKNDFDEVLSRLRRQLEMEQKQIFSEPLNQFHSKVVAFYDEKLSLVELWRYLAVGTIDAAKYPHLEKLFQVLDQEASVSEENLDVSIRKMAEGFQKKVLPKLSQKSAMKFNGAWQAYRSGQLEKGAFLSILMKLGKEAHVSPKLTPAMRQVLGGSETLAHIKGTYVFDELSNYLKDQQSKLVTNDAERALLEKYDEWFLLKNLMHLELTRDQWIQFQAWRSAQMQLTPAMRSPLFFDFAALLKPFIQFYEMAEARDKAFHRNLEKIMKTNQSQSAVVLTGGFHARGFEAALKEQGYSYAVIMPKMNSLRGHELYDDVMEGKVSYKAYLKSTFYDAFMQHATLGLVRAMQEPDFRKSLRLWRDDIIRKLAQEGRLAESGRYTSYIDQLYRAHRDLFGNRNPMNREEMIQAITDETERFKNQAVENLWQKFEVQFAGFKSGLADLVQKDQLTQKTLADLWQRSSGAKPSTIQSIAVLDGSITPGESRLFVGGAFKRFEIQESPPLIAATAEVYGEVLQDLAKGAPPVTTISAEARQIAESIKQAASVMSPEVPGADANKVRASVNQVLNQAIPNQEDAKSVLAAQVLAALDENNTTSKSPINLAPLPTVASATKPVRTLALSETRSDSEWIFEDSEDSEEADTTIYGVSPIDQEVLIDRISGEISKWESSLKRYDLTKENHSFSHRRAEAFLLQINELETNIKNSIDNSDLAKALLERLANTRIKLNDLISQLPPKKTDDLLPPNRTEPSARSETRDLREPQSWEPGHAEFNQLKKTIAENKRALDDMRDFYEATQEAIDIIEENIAVLGAVALKLWNIWNASQTDEDFGVFEEFTTVFAIPLLQNDLETQTLIFRSAKAEQFRKFLEMLADESPVPVVYKGQLQRAKEDIEGLLKLRAVLLPGVATMVERSDEQNFTADQRDKLRKAVNIILNSSWYQANPKGFDAVLSFDWHENGFDQVTPVEIAHKIVYENALEKSKSNPAVKSMENFDLRNNLTVPEITIPNFENYTPDFLVQTIMADWAGLQFYLSLLDKDDTLAQRGRKDIGKTIAALAKRHADEINLLLGFFETQDAKRYIAPDSETFSLVSVWLEAFKVDFETAQREIDAYLAPTESPEAGRSETRADKEGEKVFDQTERENVTQELARAIIKNGGYKNKYQISYNIKNGTIRLIIFDPMPSTYQLASEGDSFDLDDSSEDPPIEISLNPGVKITHEETKGSQDLQAAVAAAIEKIKNEQTARNKPRSQARKRYKEKSIDDVSKQIKRIKKELGKETLKPERLDRIISELTNIYAWTTYSNYVQRRQGDKLKPLKEQMIKQIEMGLAKTLKDEPEKIRKKIEDGIAETLRKEAENVSADLRDELGLRQLITKARIKKAAFTASVEPPTRSETRGSDGETEKVVELVREIARMDYDKIIEENQAERFDQLEALLDKFASDREVGEIVGDIYTAFVSDRIKDSLSQATFPEEILGGEDAPEIERDLMRFIDRIKARSREKGELHETLVRVLGLALFHPNQNIQARAVQALLALPEQDIKFLAPILQSLAINENTKNIVLFWLVTSFGKVAGDELLAPLVANNHIAKQVRLQAIRALATKPLSEELMNQLIGVIFKLNEDIAVIRAAMQTLAKQGDIGIAASVLTAFMIQSNEDLSTAAEEAFATLGGRIDTELDIHSSAAEVYQERNAPRSETRVDQSGAVPQRIPYEAETWIAEGYQNEAIFFPRNDPRIPTEKGNAWSELTQLFAIAGAGQSGASNLVLLGGVARKLALILAHGNSKNLELQTFVNGVFISDVDGVLYQDVPNQNDPTGKNNLSVASDGRNHQFGSKVWDILPGRSYHAMPKGDIFKHGIDFSMNRIRAVESPEGYYFTGPTGFFEDLENKHLRLIIPSNYELSAALDRYLQFQLERTIPFLVQFAQQGFIISDQTTKTFIQAFLNRWSSLDDENLKKQIALDVIRKVSARTRGDYNLDKAFSDSAWEGIRSSIFEMQRLTQEKSAQITADPNLTGIGIQNVTDVGGIDLGAPQRSELRKVAEARGGSFFPGFQETELRAAVIEGVIRAKAKENQQAFSRQLGNTLRGALDELDGLTEAAIIDLVTSKYGVHLLEGGLQGYVDDDAISLSEVDRFVANLLEIVAFGSSQNLGAAIYGSQNLNRAAVQEDTARLQAALAALLKENPQLALQLIINNPNKQESRVVQKALRSLSKGAIERAVILNRKGEFFRLLDWKGISVSPHTYDKPGEVLKGLVKQAADYGEVPVSVFTQDLKVSGREFGIFSILAKISEIEDKDLQNLAYTAVIYTMVRFVALDKKTQAGLLLEPELLKNFLGQDPTLASILSVDSSGNVFLASAALIHYFTTVQAAQRAA